jgi:glycolate oxidase iron-sulfur subunit
VQTDLPRDFLATLDGARADEILRSCVHCGFCNATCPTYQLLGDELDGPRGRIYLMKEMLETQQADDVTRVHLDRCLTCRACETTCPSGVRYGELLEIGRNYLEVERPRPALHRWMRRWLLAVVPQPWRLQRWIRLGRAFCWLLPQRLRRAIPPGSISPRDSSEPARAALAEANSIPEGIASPAPRASLSRRVVLLNGCVQSVSTPQVNVALVALLASRGIEVVESAAEQCCGSLALHLGAAAEARTTMIANIDALTRELDGADAVISTASGCGVTVKEYGRLLADHPAWRHKAEQLARHTVDVAEYLQGLGIRWHRCEAYQRVAWHSPCTLQHGQQVTGLVEGLLQDAGYELVHVPDAHLCCGSAGTYSLLQPELAAQLKARKLEALQQHGPDVVATANVGCQLHLAQDADVPVLHWLELLR